MTATVPLIISVSMFDVGCSDFPGFLYFDFENLVLRARSELIGYAL
jgi:hypothetical protein